LWHVSSCFMKGLLEHFACQPLLICCLCLSIRPLCVDGLERISVRDFRLYGFPSESELPASPSLRNGWRHPHFGVGISAFLAQYRLNCCSYKAVLEFVKRQRCELLASRDTSSDSSVRKSVSPRTRTDIRSSPFYA